MSRRTAWWRAPPLLRISIAPPIATPRMSRIWIAIRSVPRSLEEQVGDDVHRVQHRLALRAAVVGVEDVHRVLHDPGAAAADLVDDLGGVGHAVLPDVEPLAALSGQGPQTVVRVGEPD